MKTCKKCKENKELYEYSKKKDSKDGLRYNCKKCCSISNKDWYSVNSNERKLEMKVWKKSNSDKIRLDSLLWKKNNPAKVNALSAKRRATKLNATPNWLTKDQLEQMKKFYIKAKELELLTDIKHDVDHIVPLQGETVSGLHVPWNLQVIPASKNRRKRNKLIGN